VSTDERRLAFRHSARHVEQVLDAVGERLEDGERHFVRACDLDADASNRTVGSVLAVVADHPDAIDEVYGLGVEITVERHGRQPTGIVWEVRRR
jgi:hypothetical protein